MLLRRPEDVGLLVRDRRRAIGWSQAALAERVGSSRQWVVELEHGNAGAEIGRVLRTLSVLGVGLDALVSPQPWAARVDKESPPAPSSDDVAQPRGERGPARTHAWSFVLPSLAEVLGERSDEAFGADEPDGQDGQAEPPRADIARPDRQPPTLGRGKPR